MSNNKSGIYGIRCKVNNKLYIGSTLRLDSRCHAHFHRLRNNIHPNSHLQSAFNKYGEDNFVYFTIEECPKEILLKNEDWWIKKYQTLDRNFGYNKKEAARPLHSEETKRKISLSKIGHSTSEETKEKMSIAKLGIKHSEEHNKKIGIGNLGKKMSEEAKRKISIAQKGKQHNLGNHHSDETKQKISDKHKGKTLSIEHKQKLSDSHKNKPWSEKRRESYKNSLRTL